MADKNLASRFMFAAMQTMMDRNSSGIGLSNTITDVQKVKAGYKVTMGANDHHGGIIMTEMVDRSLGGMKIVPTTPKTHVLLLVVDAEEHQQIMEELAAEADKPETTDGRTTRDEYCEGK